MRITPVPHGLEDLVGKSGPRTPGLHMSHIYGELYQELEPNRYQKDTTPDPLRLEAGLAFESFLEDAFRARMLKGERPPEFEHIEPGFSTPILFNPDLIIFNGSTRLGEIKLTWASCREMPQTVSNGFPSKFSKWVVQMQAYCYCLDLCDAKLIGFFVNGDWDRSSMHPQLLAWDVTFTVRELKENWRMLMTFAQSKGML